ncbi:holo-ACP synthase [Chromatiales bacterium (ex Bugula neritina AB1)]|nr:holo-ACP synthase [Chromatiales bacterium (ex Bugula neritina AB1)]
MIVGTGIDLVQISRIEQVYEKRGERFASHVLHAAEFAEYEKSLYKGRLLAKRFAVKEAATKALGTGQARRVLLRHFYIQHDEHGKPLLMADGEADRLCKELGINSMHVSIADENEYAIASVILERSP